MKQLPIVDINTDTFYSWVGKVNTLINLANTEIVTANNSANGAITSGKGYVIGTFGSNTMVADTLRGGNTIATATLTITGNTTFDGSGVIKFSGGATLGANNLVHDHAVRITTTTTATQTVDSFTAATYRTAKYVISVTDPVNSKYQSTEIMVLHDGTNTYGTEYAVLTSNTVLATFSHDISAGNVRLLVTPAVANVQINVARTLIAV